MTPLNTITTYYFDLVISVRTATGRAAYGNSFINFSRKYLLGQRRNTCTTKPGNNNCFDASFSMPSNTFIFPQHVYMAPINLALLFRFVDT